MSKSQGGGGGGGVRQSKGQAKVKIIAREESLRTKLNYHLLKIF